LSFEVSYAILLTITRDLISLYVYMLSRGQGRRLYRMRPISINYLTSVTRAFSFKTRNLIDILSTRERENLVVFVYLIDILCTVSYTVERGVQRETHPQYS
jgi:hypothetical protein